MKAPLKLVLVVATCWIVGSSAARAEQVYQAINPHLPPGPQYGLILDGFFDGKGDSFVAFDLTNVRFHQDGTHALVEGTVTVNFADKKFLGRRYGLNLNYNQITNPDDLHRIHDYNPNFRYYDLVRSGRQLTNLDDPTDFATLAPSTPDGSMPFRTGIGGDSWELDQDLLGGSGWFTWRHGDIHHPQDASADLYFVMITTPEPSTLTLALIGSVGCGWAVRRRRWGRASAIVIRK